MTGAEALVRWKHPTNGEVLPGDFIPLVEKTSLMRELTAWVIEQAIAQLSYWQSRGFYLPVSINLSASDFSRPDFADELEQKIMDACLEPAQLGVECLETEKMLESPAALIGLAMLKLRGFKISLDDFGSGYSNINYLRKIPMDIIKLDRSIVSRVAHDKASRIIVSNVITLLKQLDYIVLAEGVEEASTVDILRIFEWEGLIIGLVSFILSNLMSLAYIVDINKKFFDGLKLFELNFYQIGFNFILLVFVPVGLIIGLTLVLMKKNPVISILKEI